jgi:cytochrome c oxidase subunit 2
VETTRAVDTAHEYGSALTLYSWVLGGWAVFVTAVIVFAALRYRRRARAGVSRRSEAKALEATVAVVIAGFVALLFWKTTTTEARMDRVAARPPVRIDVTAFQWGWSFGYAGSDVVVRGTNRRPPTFAVPVGQTVEFRIVARDVIHSFWVPALRFKRDAFPSHVNRFDLLFDRTGSYSGECSEFCGLDHAAMRFTALALPRARFERWLAERST